LGAACVRVPVVRVVVAVAVAVAVDVRVLLLRIRAIGWKPAVTASNVNHANSIATIADVAIVPSLYHAAEGTGRRDGTEGKKALRRRETGGGVISRKVVT